MTLNESYELYAVVSREKVLGDEEPFGLDLQVPEHFLTKDISNRGVFGFHFNEKEDAIDLAISLEKSYSDYEFKVASVIIGLFVPPSEGENV